jgi:hypothetical protein
VIIEILMIEPPLVDLMITEVRILIEDDHLQEIEKEAGEAAAAEEEAEEDGLAAAAAEEEAGVADMVRIERNLTLSLKMVVHPLPMKFNKQPFQQLLRRLISINMMISLLRPVEEIAPSILNDGRKWN